MKPRMVALAVVALVGAIATAARAQAVPGFAVDRFDPAARGSDFFSEDSLDLRGDGRAAAGVTLDWGHKPLVIRGLDGSELAAPVRDHVTLHIGANIVLFDRLRLGLDVPLVIVQRGETATVNGVTYGAAHGTGLEDTRVGADVRIVGEYGSPFTLAAGVRLFAPSGDPQEYTGQSQPRFQTRVLVAGQLVKRFEYAAHVAFSYLSAPPADGVPQGSTLDFGAAAGWRPIPTLVVGPEIAGSTVVVDHGFFGRRSTPVELLVGAHQELGKLKVGLAFGPGLTPGLGEPELRGVLSLDWVLPGMGPGHAQHGVPVQRPQSDRDGDGLPDAQDACPDSPGRATADPSTTGCPDRDGDGVPDAQDVCPDLPGDARAHGCPPDRDSDGVPDAQDACPEVAGLATSDPASNGCPGDRDGDGLRDDRDRCPDQAGPAANAGCPEPDADRDGIPDHVDTCPAEAGPAENAGCPPARKARVVITDEKLELAERIAFTPGTAALQRRSDGVLDEVAAVLQSHPGLRVIVEGHTSGVGAPARNKKLSLARAEGVRAYLVKRGVDPARLEARGYGSERPVDDDSTAAGRANNERIELTLARPGTASRP